MASHFAGAEIGYDYISTNPNGSHIYKVRLQIYRDTSGIPLALAQSMCLTSSCFAQQTINLTFLPVLPQDGGNIRQALPVPDLASCVNPLDNDMVKIEIYFFEATVTLPGNCSNWKFSWHGNARNVNNIDNLTFAGSCGSDLYVETILNNTIGQNTSPTFVNPAAKGFCVGSPFTWSQAATEPDGDSLRYQFGTPFNSPFVAGACVTPCTATFAPGYNAQQPMSTVSGITIDEKLGTFFFTPSQIETDVVNVVVEEYRYNPTLLQWIKIGTTVRDLQIPIVGSCLSSASAGPKINTSVPGFSNESIDIDSLRTYLYGLGLVKAIIDSTLAPPSQSIGVINYPCGDSVISLSFATDIVCSSIASDGTDFRLIGPDSTLTPIPAVAYNCNTDLTTDQINLVLHKPLDKNGDYYLQIKNGNDGNTLQNECGFSVAPFYTLKVKVGTCPIPTYNLKNVTVVNDNYIKLDWDAVDSTCSKKLFSSWNVLRSNKGQYFLIDQITDYYTRTFNDTTIGAYEVDNVQFEYAIQLIQNFDAKKASNTINQILLTTSTNDNQTVFTWSGYNGWSNASYELQYRLTVGSGPWENLNGPSSGQLSYNYNHPIVTSTTEGVYAYRVIATEPSPSSGLVSESNWVYLTLKSVANNEEPYITNIPNVITPNGDTENDHFSLNENTYSNISVSIYNRWGKLVYQDLNAPGSDYTQGKGWDGTDENTGRPVSDGVYFYVLQASDYASGKKEELKGPLTIIRGTH